MLLMLTVSALLLGSAVQPADQARQCELHVWPTRKLEGLGFRLYGYGLIGEAIRGRASNDMIESAMHDLVSPAAQVAALKSINLVNEFNLPAATKIVTHADPLDPKTALKVKTRHAPSSSQCYFELITVRHWLIEDIVWGDRFLSTFVFREFDDKLDVQRSQGGNGGNKLKILTLKEGGRPADTPELVAAALRANLVEYAKDARPRIMARRTTKRRS